MEQPATERNCSADADWRRTQAALRGGDDGAGGGGSFSIAAACGAVVSSQTEGGYAVPYKTRRQKLVVRLLSAQKPERRDLMRTL
jgi:hypothetical protein